ncbi:MAG: hypothetical protein KAJ66_01635 [Candidatus Omnitrophica bacterium]|nr:hypothetical protein [Candidatus Omnitrophota bacterium]
MAGFNIKDKIKGLGSGILGVLMFLGFLMIPFIFIFGILKVSEFLYPIISVLAGASIGLFLLIILPLSLFKSLHNHLAGLSIIFSHIVGASVFMFSFLTIFYYLGWIAFFFMFMFQIVSPIAAIGLFFKGQWGAGFSIILGLIFTYGMRFYGIWLLTLVEKRISGEFIQSKDVIDVGGTSDSTDQIEDIDLIEEDKNLNKDPDVDDVKYDE